VVSGEIAVVPLALGLPIYALVFSILNAVVLAVRIPAENQALGSTASRDEGPPLKCGRGG
jgi:methyltransferase